MFDYYVIYKGVCIANVQAQTEKKALNMARKMYSNLDAITVQKVYMGVIMITESIYELTWYYFAYSGTILTFSELDFPFTS